MERYRKWVVDATLVVAGLWKPLGEQHGQDRIGSLPALVRLAVVANGFSPPRPAVSWHRAQRAVVLKLEIELLATGALGTDVELPR